ncbi:hypothetical protein WMY93_014947 [Mugilogobius chulae]|uniref:Membrane-spanning 4-domains subfamily A member 4A-like n=1 Tax=Mugilogobius chulae TaxID=88201 RepID=A0AAW0P6P6_9GOBI
MAEAAVVEAAEPGLSNTPLVSVSFQKNTQRKLKFLEGEPKALGVTQLILSVFLSSCIASMCVTDEEKLELGLCFIVSCVLIFIGGSVAIAAKNLHLPTLKACVGMETVAAVASFFNLIVLAGMAPVPCFSENVNSTDWSSDFCRQMETSRYHFSTELVVVQVALLCISVTLAAYACKVVNCCTQAPKVPVIEIQVPPAPE